MGPLVEEIRADSGISQTFVLETQSASLADKTFKALAGSFPIITF
jgi:hypothetical protein